MGFRVQRKASPQVTSHPPKVPYTLQIYTIFNHVVNPSPLLEAPWCLAGCPIGPFQSPWCLPGCPNGSFLPGTSLVPPRLSKWSFPASLVVQVVLSCLPGGPIGPFLPSWCLFLPPWWLPGCPSGPFLPPWWSKWPFPATLVPP